MRACGTCAGRYILLQFVANLLQVVAICLQFVAVCCSLLVQEEFVRVPEGREHLAGVAEEQVQGQLQAQERGHKLQQSVTYCHCSKVLHSCHCSKVLHIATAGTSLLQMI